MKNALSLFLCLMFGSSGLRAQMPSIESVVRPDDDVGRGFVDYLSEDDESKALLLGDRLSDEILSDKDFSRLEVSNLQTAVYRLAVGGIYDGKIRERVRSLESGLQKKIAEDSDRHAVWAGVYIVAGSLVIGALAALPWRAVRLKRPDRELTKAAEELGIPGLATAPLLELGDVPIESVTGDLHFALADEWSAQKLGDERVFMFEVSRFLHHSRYPTYIITDEITDDLSRRLAASFARDSTLKPEQQTVYFFDPKMTQPSPWDLRYPDLRERLRFGLLAVRTLKTQESRKVIRWAVSWPTGVGTAALTAGLSGLAYRKAYDRGAETAPIDLEEQIPKGGP